MLLCLIRPDLNPSENRFPGALPVDDLGGAVGRSRRFDILYLPLRINICVEMNHRGIQPVACVAKELKHHNERRN